MIKTVTEFNGMWSNLGDLLHPREGHTSIIYDDIVLIMGGESHNGQKMRTERWDTSNYGGEYDGESTEVELEDYAYWPAAFLVDRSYCL